MKNLAEFKRALSLGSEWATFHMLANKDLGTRNVDSVQSNAVTFSMPGGESSWLYFPKASDCRFDPDDPNVVTIMEDGLQLLRYTRIIS